MDLKELTNEMIRTLNLFDTHNSDGNRNNLEARTHWADFYLEARKYYGTDKIHTPDLLAYDVANRKLKQYYNSRGEE